MTATRMDAAALRREFDETFAKPPRAGQPGAVDLLAVAAGGAHMALRLSDIRAIQICPPLTEAPSARPGLLGVGVVRGELAGLYSLGALRANTRAGAGRWAVICGDGSVGLVFDELAGYARVQPGEIGRAAGNSEYIEISGKPHMVVDVAVLLKEIAGTSE